MNGIHASCIKSLKTASCIWRGHRVSCGEGERGGGILIDSRICAICMIHNGWGSGYICNGLLNAALRVSKSLSHNSCLIIIRYEFMWRSLCRNVLTLVSVNPKAAACVTAEHFGDCRLTLSHALYFPALLRSEVGHAFFPVQNLWLWSLKRE